MPSTFSPSLRVELIGAGEQAGTWSTTTNTNLGTILEDSIAGLEAVSVISANQALTQFNGAVDQARNAILRLTTTTGAAFAVYAPPNSKLYTIFNDSAHAATVFNSTVPGNTTAAGAGVVIPANKTVTIFSDGTNFAFQNTHTGSLTLATDLAVADGGTGASDASGARTNLGVTATGADTTYAFRANNLSDLASAPTARTNLGLGSIVTQNANSVAITGGSITGITDLVVADGGTGASSFTSGGLLRGNGTSAVSVASAADIVAQIGTTAVTNATNASTATALQTARTIGGVSFNGTANINLPGVNIAGNQNTTGNAATATNATNAVNLITANFTVQQSGSDLVFLFGTNRIAKLTSAGKFVAIQVEANPTI